MDFTIIPELEYKPPKSIKTFSEGFFHTLQTLDTWRESESSGNGNNIRNFQKLRDKDQGNWGPTPHYRKEQVERLIQLARERGDDAIAQAIETSAYSGLRQSELRRLKVWDVDFHKNVFLVGGTPESRTKGRNYRKVPIHPRLLPIMEYRASSARPMDAYVL